MAAGEASTNSMANSTSQPTFDTMISNDTKLANESVGSSSSSSSSHLLAPQSLAPEAKKLASGQNVASGNEEDDDEIESRLTELEADGQESLDESETSPEVEHQFVESPPEPSNANSTVEAANLTSQKDANDTLTFQQHQETGKSETSDQTFDSDHELELENHQAPQDYEDQLSRRVLLSKRHKLSAAKITKELRKFKEAQKAKLFNGGHLKLKKRKRKKSSVENNSTTKNHSSKAKKSKKRQATKLAQTRQELTTASSFNGNPLTAASHAQLISAGFAADDPSFSSLYHDQLLHQQQVGSSNLGSLTSTIKQHFPSLQISSAVQKLLTSKLNPQVAAAAASASAASLGLGELPLAGKYSSILKYPSSASADASAIHHHPQVVASSMFLQHQQANQMDASGLPHLPEYFNQWASSEETPSYMSTTRQLLRNPANDKVVPVEIIGLDPSITGSILYGDSTAAGHPSASGSAASTPEESQAVNSNSIFNGADESAAGHSSAPVSPMQLHPGTLVGSVPASGDGLRSNASSVLHIHHFHHTNGAVKSSVINPNAEPEPQQQPEAAQSQAGEANQAPAGGETGGETETASTSSEQAAQQQQQQQQQQPAPVPEGAKAYVNEKGELVYVAADGQVITPQTGEQEQATGTSSKQSQESSQHQDKYPSVVPQTNEDQRYQGEPNDQQQQQPESSSIYQQRPASQQQYYQEQPSASRIRLQGHQYRWKHRLNQPDEMVKVMERPSRHQQVETEGGKQMLMVAYRPQNLSSRLRVPISHNNSEQIYNATMQEQELSAAPDPTRNFYGEGQESTSVSTKQQFASMRDLHKLHGSANGNYNTNITDLLERPKLQSQLYSANNVNSLLNAVKLNNQQANRLRANQAAENRVPILPLRAQTIPMILESVKASASQSQLSGNNNNNNDSLIDTWLRLAKNDFQLQQLNRLNPFGLVNQTQNQQVIENLALLKHLQQVNSRIQQQQQQQQQQHNQNRLNSLASVNSTKLTNEQLMSLLHELKSNSTSSLSLPTLISSSANSQQVEHANELSNLDLINTKGQRFEMASASDPSGKYSTNFLLHRPANGSLPKILPEQTLIALSSGNPIGGEHNHHHHHHHQTTGNKIPSDDLRQQISTSIGTNQGKINPQNTANGSNNSSNNQQDHQQESILSDSGNLGHIALAFILVVSLLTITIVVVAMIYRYKRRSIAGCSRLPGGRSRLNLTQRTKHFMRSNFVKPTDVTSIKSFNIDSNLEVSGVNSSKAGNGKLSSGQKGGGAGGGGNNNKTGNQISARSSANLGANSSPPGCRSAAAAAAAAAASSSRQTSSKQLFNGPTLSTFNGISSTLSSQSDGRYHFTDLDGHTDIRTLNTRLQKPSQLTRQPDNHCNGNNGKHNKSSSHASKTIKPTSGTGACYLNLRQQLQQTKMSKQQCHMEDLNQVNRL